MPNQELYEKITKLLQKADDNQLKLIYCFLNSFLSQTF